MKKKEKTVVIDIITYFMLSNAWINEISHFCNTFTKSVFNINLN